MRSPHGTSWPANSVFQNVGQISSGSGTTRLGPWWSGLGGALLLLSTGCTTKAVGIEQCKEIEYLRCEASVSCGVIDADDVEECKRVYHDQCLHGIAGPKEPTADQQKLCVNRIKEAKEIAESTLNDDSQVSEHEAACRVISEPWKQTACDFLNEEEENTGGSSSE